MKKENIFDSIAKIKSSIKEIYKFINTNRYQTDLLKDSQQWNQICSSLWVIDDTILSIRAYLESEYPIEDGLKYIYTYGILQSLFIQQDAVENLSEAFSLPFLNDNYTLKAIREIRNATIGHPTKMIRKRTNYYNYISRISLSKYFFTFETTNKNNPSNFRNIEVDKLILDQLTELEKIIERIGNELSNRDKEHRMNFKDNLINCFSAGLDYQFEKIFSAIFNPRSDNVDFGLSMLGIVRKTYQSFESELSKRNEIYDDSPIKYDLDNYYHAINRLEEYFTNKNRDMNNLDATVYAYYIREEHKSFLKIAAEIDEEYNQ